MAKQRIHVSNLKIRLPRSAARDARSIAENIGREILKNIAGDGRPRSGAIGDVAIGGIKMSDNVAARVGEKTATEVGKQIGNGGRE